MSSVDSGFIVGSETITNTDYVDITFTTPFLNVPAVSVSSSENVNIYITNLTTTGVRINFSNKFVGTVYYCATALETEWLMEQ